MCVQMFWRRLISLLQMSVWCFAPAVKRRAVWSFRWSVCERLHFYLFKACLRLCMLWFISLYLCDELCAKVECIWAFQIECILCYHLNLHIYIYIYIYKKIKIEWVIINLKTQSAFVLVFQGTADPERALTVAKLVWVDVFISVSIIYSCDLAYF